MLEEIELSSVGMNDIFEKEGLRVTDDELRAEVASVTEEFGQNGQAFDQERLEEQAMEVLKVGLSCSLSITSFVPWMLLTWYSLGRGWCRRFC